MKTVITCALLASFVGVPCLFAAEVVGLVPSLPIGPEALLGGYVAGGLLAFVACDYGRRPAPRPPRRPKAVAQPSAPPPARQQPILDWEHHTVSA